MSLKLLQEAAGVKPDGQFGPATFKAAKKYLNLPSDIAAVHFFAQTSHETGEFTLFEENLNYSKEGLLKTFGKYFNETTAAQYARNPEKIANRVYANRMGNGDEESGDGWRFRGRGAIQLTGRFNYQKFAEYMSDLMIVKDPDRVKNELSFVAAGWFFDKNGIFDMSVDFKEDTVKKVTKAINGGYNGLAHRQQLTNKYAAYI
jgi:putative chitinase